MNLVLVSSRLMIACLKVSRDSLVSRTDVEIVDERKRNQVHNKILCTIHQQYRLEGKDKIPTIDPSN